MLERQTPSETTPLGESCNKDTPDLPRRRQCPKPTLGEVQNRAASTPATGVDGRNCPSQLWRPILQRQDPLGVGNTTGSGSTKAALAGRASMMRRKESASFRTANTPLTTLT